MIIVQSPETYPPEESQVDAYLTVPESFVALHAIRLMESRGEVSAVPAAAREDLLKINEILDYRNQAIFGLPDTTLDALSSVLFDLSIVYELDVSNWYLGMEQAGRGTALKPFAVTLREAYARRSLSMVSDIRSFFVAGPEV